MDKAREGVGETSWESSRETNTLPYVKYITICKICKIASRTCCMTLRAQTHALWQSREVGWDRRWEGGLRGGDIFIYIYIPMAGWYWCKAEINTILQSKYPPVKNR